MLDSRTPEFTSQVSHCLRSRTPPAPVENTQIIYFSLQAFFPPEVKNVPVTFKLMFQSYISFFQTESLHWQVHYGTSLLFHSHSHTHIHSLADTSLFSRSQIDPDFYSLHQK